MRFPILAAAVALFLTACGTSAGMVDTDTSVGRAAIVDNDETAFIASLSEYEQKGTVWLVNSALTTRQVLDDDCRLHSDAARHIMRERARSHGMFWTIQEIADVKQVGVYNLSLLVDCAYDKGWIQVETSTLYEDYNALPAYLQVVVDDLLVRAQSSVSCDPNSGWGCYPSNFRFRRAEIVGHGTVVTEGVIQLGRIIDPEGGIVETVDYILDGDLQVVSEHWDAG